MKQKRAMVIVIVILFLALGVLACFIFVANRDDGKVETEVEVSAVQTILLKNLDKNYPPTPREVLRYYLDATNCFYNEIYTEEEFLELAQKVQLLYDDDLNANMTEEEYLSSLRADIENMKTNDIVVSGYTISAATDVDYFTVNEESCARLYCTYRLRQGTKYLNTEEIFVMRKDESGHWKILGFKLVEGDEPTESEVNGHE